MKWRQMRDGGLYTTVHRHGRTSVLSVSPNRSFPALEDLGGWWWSLHRPDANGHIRTGVWHGSRVMPTMYGARMAAERWFAAGCPNPNDWHGWGAPP